MVYPSLRDRYLSTAFDMVVLTAFVVGLTAALQGPARALMITRVLVGFLVIANYEPVLTSKACTVGQAVVGIRVRSHRDWRNRVSLGRAYLRTLVKVFLGVYSFFAMGFNKERRALHDFASDTIVLGVNEARNAQSAGPGA